MQFWGDFLENFFGFLPIFGVIFTQKAPAKTAEAFSVSELWSNFEKHVSVYRHKYGMFLSSSNLWPVVGKLVAIGVPHVIFVGIHAAAIAPVGE
jgi:hypothetical protein